MYRIFTTTATKINSRRFLSLHLAFSLFLGEGRKARRTWRPGLDLNTVWLSPVTASLRVLLLNKRGRVFFWEVVECKADSPPPVQEGALLGLGCFGEIGGVWLLTF